MYSTLSDAWDLDRALEDISLTQERKRQVGLLILWIPKADIVPGLLVSHSAAPLDRSKHRSCDI